MVTQGPSKPAQGSTAAARGAGRARPSSTTGKPITMGHKRLWGTFSVRDTHALGGPCSLGERWLRVDAGPPLHPPQPSPGGPCDASPGATSPPPHPIPAPEMCWEEGVMLRCLFQPPEESRRRGGVGVQWGEGWGCLPWPPGLSPAPLLLSPPLPLTHSSSLLCPPTGTLSAHRAWPHAASCCWGSPSLGGGGHCPPLPHRAASRAGGSMGSRSPPELGGGHAGWEHPGSEPGGEWGAWPRSLFLPIPGITAIHSEKCQLRGRPAVLTVGGTGRIPTPAG